jgi:death-on-curing protein
MDDPIWITRELAVAIHQRQLAEHGGANGVRDEGMLDSALGRPRHLFAYADPTPSIPTLAASYAFGIAKNHAFIDGNKRTAHVVYRVFLALNGYEITATQEARYAAMLRLAAGDTSEEDFAAWLTQHTTRLS